MTYLLISVTYLLIFLDEKRCVLGEPLSQPLAENFPLINLRNCMAGIQYKPPTL